MVTFLYYFVLFLLKKNTYTQSFFFPPGQKPAAALFLKESDFVQLIGNYPEQTIGN